MKLAMRVDGNRHIGLGHFYRCFRLALGLRSLEDVEAEFLLLESSLSPRIESILANENLQWHVISLQENPWVEDLEKTGVLLTSGGYGGALVDLLIPDSGDNDLLDNLEYRPIDVKQWLNMASETGLPLAAISDQYMRMDMKADLIINSCPAQYRSWYEPSPDRVYLIGNESYPLGEDFQPYRAKPKIFSESVLQIVCFFGGNDHAGFADPVVEVLLGLDLPLTVRLLIGASTPEGEARAAQFRAMGVEAEFAVPDIAARFFEADLVICASGTTLQDLAAIGIPSVTFATRKRQEVTARFFDEAGCGRYLGRWSERIAEPLHQVIRELYEDRKKLYEMSAAGKGAVDGKGMKRVCDAVSQMVKCSV